MTRQTIKMQQFIIITIVSLAAISASVLNSLPPESQSLKPRIINGQPAVKGQFPYQVAIVTVNTYLNQTIFCGGAIISEDWILTTANCISGSAYSVAYSGIVDLNDPDRILSVGGTHIVHENYSENWGDYLYDIGLIKLDVPLVFDDNTKPITLAEEEPEDGIDVTILGFGHTSGLFGTITDNNTLLNYAVASIMNNTRCQQLLNVWNVPKPEIMCTDYYYNGDESKIINACIGDAGSPVVLNADTEPILVGTFSFLSSAGCNYTYPSAHSRTAYFREWIRGITGV